MLNRRQFIKTALTAALMTQFPCIAFADKPRFLYEKFGDLPPPETIERVLSTGPVADVLLLSLVPTKLIGLSSLKLTESQKQFLPPILQNLPQTGRFAGRGSTASLENVIALKPDVIVDIGNVSPSYVSTAERINAQTNIPYILMNGTLSETATQIRTLGEMLGVKDHADGLADYAERVLTATHNIAQKSGVEKPLKVYSARGADGLETGLAGSIHTEVLEWVGATNAAQDAGENLMTRVSMEQLMLWQPDVIITLDENFYQEIGKNPLWQRIKAVQEGRIYKAPKLPFGWLDQPPSINRLLGASWLSHVLYPELMPAEQYTKAVIEYYALFYQHYLSEEALIAMTTGA